MDILFVMSEKLEAYWEAEQLQLAYLFGAEWLRSAFIGMDTTNRYFVVRNCTDEEQIVLKIVSRSVCIKCAIEIYASGKSFEELLSADGSKIPVLTEEKWKIDFHNYNKHPKGVERLETINRIIKAFPNHFLGKVSLKEPDIVFWLCRKWNGDDSELRVEEAYFGRLMAESNRSKYVHEYSLKRRKYLSTTSCDSELAFLFCNLAGIKRGDVVADPFCGSSSILISAASIGAYVVGGDNDPRVLLGDIAAPESPIVLSFGQYSLQSHMFGFSVNDVARDCLRGVQLFDAVLGDPPYGVRESTKRKHVRVEKSVKNKKGEGKSEKGNVDDVISSLFAFSAKNLRLLGMLVFWLPVMRKKYDENDLPGHPQFTLVANCENIVTSQWSRRMLAYRKVNEASSLEIGKSCVRTPYEFSEEAYKRRRHRDIKQ